MSKADDIFWALRTLRDFVADEMSRRAWSGDDAPQQEARAAYGALNLLRHRVLQIAEDKLGERPADV